jgi:hypothetical protein
MDTTPEVYPREQERKRYPREQGRKGHTYLPPWAGEGKVSLRKKVNITLHGE